MPTNIQFAVALGLCAFIPSVMANTEKVIISGPSSSSTFPPSLLELDIPVLTTVDWSVRHHIPAAFPSSSFPDGLPSWYLLSGLTPGQGYEVRLCWAATQPTAFKMTAYDVQVVLNDQPLLHSIRSAHSGRKDGADLRQRPAESAMLLRVNAAADYFSANSTLMTNVPPVFVDVILDPHIIPGVPRSLLPSIGSIAVVAVASFFLARIIAVRLGDMAVLEEPLERKRE